MSAEKLAIMVLGMHRSGTSALARVLGLLGVELGEDLLPAAPDNVRGFWENRGFVRLHETFFENQGLDWNDPAALPDGWERTTAGRNLQARLADELRHQFADSRLFAVKDPRMSRLLPVWKDALIENRVQPACVIVVRHPDEVAASLAERDGLPRALSRLLWMRYLLDAEYGSRGLPRVFVQYEQLLADWRGQVARIAQQLSLDGWPVSTQSAQGEVGAFLDLDLRHHRAPSTAPLPRPLAMAYRLACGAAEGAATADADFDALGQLLDDHIVLCGGLGGHVRKRVAGAELALAGDGGITDVLWQQQLGVPRGDLCKVYFRSDEGTYTEENTVAHRVTSGLGVVTVHFDLPADAVADFVRVDLAETPGLFRMLELEIGGKKLGDMEQRLLRVNGRVLAPLAREFCRLLAEDDDPYVEMDLRGTWAPSDPRRISIAYERESLRSQLHALSRDSSEEAALDTVAAQLAQVHEQLAGATHTLAAFDNSAHQRWQATQQQVEQGLQAIAATLVDMDNSAHKRWEHLVADGRADLEGRVGELAARMDQHRAAQAQADAQRGAQTQAALDALALRLEKAHASRGLGHWLRGLFGPRR